MYINNLYVKKGILLLRVWPYVYKKKICTSLTVDTGRYVRYLVLFHSLCE